MEKMKMTTCLWFDKNAEEAVAFYSTVFKDFSRGKTAYYGNEGQEVTGIQPGTVLTIEFSLLGNSFLALNAGPHFKFNEAISLVINCQDQPEIDYYWDKLTANGGQESQCGWLKDRFGLSWQITPVQMNDMQNADGTMKDAVMRAMLTMKKLDLAALEQANAE